MSEPKYLEDPAYRCLRVEDIDGFEMAIINRTEVIYLTLHTNVSAGHAHRTFTYEVPFFTQGEHHTICLLLEVIKAR